MRHCPQAELHDLRAQIRQKELRTAEVQKRLTELEAAGAAEYLRSILVWRVSSRVQGLLQAKAARSRSAPS